VVGLVKYGAEALKSAGAPIDVYVAVGLSIPVVALSVGFSIRRLRKKIDKASSK